MTRKPMDISLSAADGQTKPVPMGRTFTLGSKALQGQYFPRYREQELPKVGDILSHRYELRAPLGSGTYGRVFQAWDRTREQSVAIKILQTRHPMALRRFKNEFRAFREIRHPNLVRVYQLGRDADTWFLVMQHVEGVSFIVDEKTHTFQTAEREKALQPTVERHTHDARRAFASDLNGKEADDARMDVFTPLLEASAIRDRIGQLAQGLLALHRRDIIHCDVKPSNVLVTKSGHVVLLDFGVSRFTTHLAIHHRDSGNYAGTRPYLAPEIKIQTAATPALDWYAVGIILAELLTGQPPERLRSLSYDDRCTQFREAARHAPAYADLWILSTHLMHPDPAQRADYRDIFLTCYGDDAKTIEDQTPSYLPFYNARPEELARLERLYTTFRKGRATTVIVESLPHMGKDTLCQLFLRRVVNQDPEVRVLTAQCRSDELLGYRAFDEIVDGISCILASLPAEEQNAFRSYCTPSLCTLFPALKIMQGELPANQLDDPLMALRTLLITIAKRFKLVLLVKDIHCADTASLQWISRLFSPGTGPNVFLLLTRRPNGEMTDDLIDTHTLHHAVPRIGLYPLNDRMAIDVARTWLPKEHAQNQTLIDTIVRVADGRAGTIRIICSKPDMLEYLSQGTSLDDLIQQVLTLLSEEHRHILYAVSTAVYAMSLERLSYVTEQSIPTLCTNLALLTSLFLIEEADAAIGEQYQLADARIRTLIKRYTKPTVLHHMHQKMAESGQERHLSPLSPTTIVHHYICAQCWDEAKDHAIRFATTLADAHAYEAAVPLYQMYFQVLDETGEKPTREIMTRALDIYSRAGHFERAAKLLVDLADQSIGKEQTAFRLRAAEHFYLAGNTSDAKAQMQRTEIESFRLHRPHLLPSRVRQNAAFQITQLVFRSFRVQQRLDQLDPTQFNNRALDPGVAALLSTYKITGLEVSITNGLRALELVIKELNLALDLGRNATAATAIANYVSYIASGYPSIQNRALRYLDLAEELAFRAHDPLSQEWVAIQRASIDYQCGHYQRAWQQMLKSHQWISRNAPDQRMMLSFIQVYIVLCAIIFGKTDELRASYYHLVSDARERNNRMSESAIILTGFATWLFDDAPKAARTVLGQLTDPVVPGRLQLYDLLLIRNYAELALYEQESQLYDEHLRAYQPFENSPLLKGLAVGRHEAQWTQARLLWARARSHAPLTPTEIQKLHTWGNAMVQHPAALSAGWGHHILAGTSYMNGDLNRCLLQLQRCIKINQAHGLNLYAELARAAMQHMQNHGDPSYDRLYALGIVAPERLLFAYHPYLAR